MVKMVKAKAKVTVKMLMTMIMMTMVDVSVLYDDHGSATMSLKISTSCETPLLHNRPDNKRAT